MHNAGPSDVTGAVTVTDPLPAGLSYISATGTDWSCSYDTGTRTVTCALAAGLAAGADAPTINLATTVDSDIGSSTLINIADVSSGTTDDDLSNNSGTDSVTVATSAALSLTKTLTSATPVLAGTDADFDLVASNAGPSDASSVTVTDTLPDHLSLDDYSGTGWTCSTAGQDVICSRAGIAAHASAPVLTLHALVSAGIPVSLPTGSTTVSNAATIDSSTPGSNSNPAPVSVPVQAHADLRLAKTPQSGTAIAGSTYLWHLAVHNAGPSDAAGPITVTDPLPGYQTYLSAGAGWDCTASAAPTPPSPTSHQTVSCTLAAGLAAGATAPTLDLSVQLDGDAPAGDQTNTATANSPTPGSQGSDTATVTVRRSAVLSITKRHVGNATIGQTLDFTLSVHNAGPSTADQIRVTDPLPDGLSYRAADGGTGWSCAAVSGVLRCDLAGSLPAGGDAPTITLTTTVTAAAYPSVTNAAQVSSTDADLPDTATGSDLVTVPPSADLQLAKTHLGTFTVGAVGNYRLTVHNAGRTESPGPLVLSDTLPDGLSYDSASGAGWTCTARGASVSCNHPAALAAGATSKLVLTVHVLPSAFDPSSRTIQNTATVTGGGSPPAHATDTAPVKALSVLSIDKKLVSYADNLATYRITVANLGPNPTDGPLSVTDRLPTGLRLRSVQASQASWQCDDTVVCLRSAPMPAGSRSTITIVTAVTAPAGSRINLGVLVIRLPAGAVHSGTMVIVLRLPAGIDALRRQTTVSSHCQDACEASPNGARGPVGTRSVPLSGPSVGSVPGWRR